MMLVRLEPTAPRSQVKHSTTEPLRSLISPLCAVGSEILENISLPLLSLFVLFDSLRPINNLSVINTKLGFMFLLKDTTQ